MSDWCLQNPYLTFWLGIAACFVLCNLTPIVVVQKVEIPKDKEIP